MGIEDQFMQLFVVEEEGNRLALWDEWISRLERLMSIKSITDDKLKQNYLFFFWWFRSRKESFKSRYNPQVSKVHFRDMNQFEGEPFDDFVNRLKEKAKMCAFKDENEEIAFQIIHRSQSTALKRRALESEIELTLEEVIRIGKMEESVNAQINEFKKTTEKVDSVDKLEVNKLGKSSGSSSSRGSKESKFSGKATISSYNSKNKDKDTRINGKKCFKCGNGYPHEKICPAKGKMCHKCNGYDHFAKCCKKSGSDKRHVRRIEEESDSGSNSSFGKVWRIKLKSKIMAIKDWLMPLVTLWLGGVSLGFGVDTGTYVNIIDESSFKKLKNRPKLYKSNSKLYAYGQEDCIGTLGQFKTRIKYNNQYKSVEFVVTRGNFGNLLSYKTCVELGIMAKINTVNGAVKDSVKEKFIRKYPQLFSGKVGILKNHQVNLHIDESIKPIQQKLRPVPFHLRPLVEAEIVKMLEQDIIEPVKGPTPWVSPIVPVPKPDRPNEVRICTDAREMNKAILRTSHSFPTVEDLAVKLNGAKFISKFDLKSGYMQLLLAEKSRYITAFCTHMGIFQYKRLNFGINAASEIFQRVIEQVLSGLDGTMNFSDDIIVFGTTKAEHDARLEAVLKRLNESGLTVNEPKYQGISIDSSKCDALLKAKAPATIGEIRSLLGLANYCSRFIPDYASVVEPLRRLTKKGTKWSWGPEHDKALERMKKSLCTSALSYFDPSLRTEITVDASPVGVAAVLSQYDPKHPSEKRIVMYASRSLTKVEQKYSQVEREALALVWACEKFHLYIYAKDFDIITDNKAVELIFAGAFNIADYMSRNPVGVADNGCEKYTESYVNLVSNMSIPSAISRKELVQATKEDTELKEVIKMIEGKRYDKVDAYERIKMELSLSKDGLVLRGNRVVIPKLFQKRVIKIAHSGHLGIVKTKQLLRTHVWFPTIDSQIENLVKTCHKCQINTDLTKFEPSCPTEMPDRPWILVSMDFYGPLKCGKYLLVLVCEYSRYPIVKVISGTSAFTVIPVLNEIFSEFGIPCVLKSDNGPPFNSYDFKLFAKEQGFKHKRITPLWPRSNGMCERFMRNLGKVMRNSSYSQIEWEAELIEFLRNYRDTPHSSTGVAPNKLLFQSKSKTSKLPNFSDNLNVKEQLHLKAREQDSKAKAKMKAYNDRKLKAQTNNFKIGDLVLLKWKRTRKSDSLFDPKPFKIAKIDGSMITLERNGSLVVRNSSFIKRYIQKEVEKSRSKILKDILFDDGDFSNSFKTEHSVMDQEATSEDQSSTVGSDDFETGKEDCSKSVEGGVVVGQSLTDEDGEKSNLQEFVEQVEDSKYVKPKRSIKQPSWYGNPVQCGTRAYNKKTKKK
ncbi:unnamed protein product, partial [Brachionus calyciflorus]